jgi:hypothetical protein
MAVTAAERELETARRGRHRRLDRPAQPPRLGPLPSARGTALPTFRRHRQRHRARPGQPQERQRQSRPRRRRPLHPPDSHRARRRPPAGGRLGPPRRRRVRHRRGRSRHRTGPRTGAAHAERPRPGRGSPARSGTHPTASSAASPVPGTRPTPPCTSRSSAAAAQHRHHRTPGSAHPSHDRHAVLARRLLADGAVDPSGSIPGAGPGLVRTTVHQRATPPGSTITPTDHRVWCERAMRAPKARCIAPGFTQQLIDAMGDERPF